MHLRLPVSLRVFRVLALRRMGLGLVALGLAWLSSALSGCAPSLRYDAGRALLAQPRHAGYDTLPMHSLSGKAPHPVGLPPDSLDADLVLVAHEGRRKTEVFGRLFARPGHCGKLDLYGMPGMLGGAFRWRNADWELAVYDPPRYDSGQGSRVPLPLPGGAEAPYDALFAPLWGALLPWMPGTPLRRDSVRTEVFSGPGEGGRWSVAFDVRTGLPDTLWDEDGGWTLIYGQWRSMQGRLVPALVTCLHDGRVWLEVGLKQVRDNPTWKRDPFVLRKPKIPES